MKKLIFAFILINLLGVSNVFAREIGSFTLAKSGTLTSDYLTLYQGSGNFANWGQGTLVYTFGYTTTNTGSLNLPVLTSAYADSGGNSYVCEFGSVAITSPSTSTNATTGVSYTIACPMEMGSNGLTNLGLIFSNQFNTAYQFNYSTSYSIEFITDDTFSSSDIVNAIAQNAYYTQQVIISETNDLSTILNNLNQNIQNTITNQNQNTQDIINNQNQNTQQEIESQKVCQYIDKSNITIDNSSLISSSGTVASGWPSYGITDYVKISNTTKIKILTNFQTSSSRSELCFYNINKQVTSCILNVNLSINQYLTIPTNSSYVRFTINKVYNEPQFEICNNGNQALSDNINNLNDSITSESQPNTNQDINDMNDMVASDTPISDLITLPITLINAYINGVNSSCSPVNLGNLYGTDLILPCINLEQRLGSNLWHIIDAFFSIFMCYNIGMLFVSAFDGITSLRDDFEGLYQPRHADSGYVPKHGGGN